MKKCMRENIFKEKASEPTYLRLMTTDMTTKGNKLIFNEPITSLSIIDRQLFLSLPQRQIIVVMQGDKKSKSKSKSSKTLEKHAPSKSTMKSSLSYMDTPNPFKSGKIRLGICAMKKKVESKPMKEIRSRLECPQLDIILMWQCLELEWTQWPVVDAMICFYSDGFPYLKAWRYVQKHQPFLINDLQKQQLLWDRSVIYNMLQNIKVPVPKHYVVHRDDNHLSKIQNKTFGKITQVAQQQVQEIKSKSSKAQINKPTLLRDYYQKYSQKRVQYTVDHQDQDFIILKRGETLEKIKKPFVEKPFESQNHQICIYYPADMGGGRKKLFRKKKNTSSEYSNSDNEIRRDGSYIYEEYLPTNGFDIKVYTIGPYYMYAEARKSPTLDGVVVRNKDGKQSRFPVILTPQQKYICNRIVQEFSQNICGFDLLRANGKSYVCDVNGWSFVKGNPKYWEDCSKILRKKLITHFFPRRRQQNLTLNKIAPVQNQFRPQMDYPLPKVQQLRSIVSIFRHADRSPKMKIKIKTDDKRFISLFDGIKKDEVKFKDAKNLTKILNFIVEKIAQLDHTDPLMKDYMQIKFVLQSGGHFEGLTRKLQFKVAQRGEPEEQNPKGLIKKVILIIKWGGDLTYLGYEDAIELGKKMRQERYDDNDCLSLFSSYKHDLKTYASDEGRCIKTAAAFLKGFLSIEGELAPIISSMVQADAKAQRLLDCTSEQNHSNLGDKVCQRLYEMMNRNKPILQSYLQHTTIQKVSQKMIQTMKEIDNPRQKLKQLDGCIHNLVDQLQRVYMEDQDEESAPSSRKSNSIPPTEECESIMLINSRWIKLKKDFYDKKTELFNISKIPQIYDTVRHDYHRNGRILININTNLKQTLYKLSRLLAHFTVCNEFGITDEQKVSVATDICLPLMEKILVDLMFWKDRTEEEGFWKYKNPTEGDNWRHIRTRLYFTSASHMYSLLSILTRGNKRMLLRNSPEQNAKHIFNILYMSYLSHIELRLYQNLTCEPQDPNRFRLEITFSTRFHKNQQLKQLSIGGKGLTINEIQQFIHYFLQLKKLRKKQSNQHSMSKQKKYKAKSRHE